MFPLNLATDDQPAARRILVGDVHGCIDELQDLLALVRFDAEDRLILVGDLVAKGPDSGAVVSLCRQLGARAVRGNHDQHVLSLAAGASRKRPPSPDHQQALAQLGPDDLAWLGDQPHILLIPEERILVVHGGLDPRRSLGDQRPGEVMTMRSIAADGAVSSRVDRADAEPWAKCWMGPELVVFGHDAIRGLQQHPHAIGLDTGCVYGGRLSALLLPDRRILSVQARRSWAPRGGMP